MKLQLIVFCLVLVLFVNRSVAGNNDKVYIDKNGTMRWSADNSEAAFFGVNYTLPFAHAYRAMNYLGVDHKAAIDRDVYHFARLGFNAYRVHIWDVEISDSYGNLRPTEHLDLLDYLIAKLKERNIEVVLTAMTNFGNGYPEQNVPTDGFSYMYKARDHSDPKAIEVEQCYIAQLVSHINPYTGLAYKNDSDIIGFEINNEPHHSVSTEQTKAYINSMVKAIRGTGCEKPIFYNVSHNIDKAEAYFSSDIQGTTYQWYPIGLVANHKRLGNFLSYVDHYPIPYKGMKDYDKMAKLVYEFSPADNMYTYLYPAMARSFRTAGFSWITQFAYDPIDMAQYNTEYQTHYLNLAYTPQKAISMKIAGEVVRGVPFGKSYGTYPANNQFENFRVSYEENLSEMNSKEKFFYTNNTIMQPVALDQISEVAGCGSSSVVQYDGLGAYFLDKIKNGIWRLEVMPDALEVSDPFEKASLKKEVVKIFWDNRAMTINLPNLGNVFIVSPLNKGNNYTTATFDGNFIITPGTYLLCKFGLSIDKLNSSTPYHNIKLGEFVAPKPSSDKLVVVHRPKETIETGNPLEINVQIAGCKPDSVIIYSDRVNFYAPSNPYLKLVKGAGFTYSAVVPEQTIKVGEYKYNLVVCTGGEQYTFPQGIIGSPLDWDFYQKEYYHTKVIDKGTSVILFDPVLDADKVEVGAVGEWARIGTAVIRDTPSDAFVFKISTGSPERAMRNRDADQEPRPKNVYLHKYIKNEIEARKNTIDTCSMVGVLISKTHNFGNIKISFISSDGYTYTAAIDHEGSIRIPFSAFKQDSTLLLPVAYPVFMPRYFVPEKSIEFKAENIEYLLLQVTEAEANKQSELRISPIWLE